MACNEIGGCRVVEPSFLVIEVVRPPQMTRLRVVEPPTVAKGLVQLPLNRSLGVAKPPSSN
jgi:hypothetical protein